MPFLKVDNLQLITEIKNSIESIKAEFNSMKLASVGSIKPNVKTNFGNDLTYGNILTYALKLDRALLDPAEKELFDKNYAIAKPVIETRKRHCKTITEIVSRYTEVRQCFFNEAYGNSKIRKHYGVNGITAGSTPDHLRLQVTINPGKNCFFYIEKDGHIDSLEYTDGLVFGFNDGLDLHWVENHGEKTRVVLILDIQRSAITESLHEYD